MGFSNIAYTLLIYFCSLPSPETPILGPSQESGFLMTSLKSLIKARNHLLAHPSV